MPPNLWEENDRFSADPVSAKPNGATNLPTITVKAGERHKAPDAAVEALVGAGMLVYQRAEPV